MPDGWDVEVTIPGRPIAWQRAGSNGRVRYTPTRVAQAQDEIRWLTIAALPGGWDPTPDPVRLDLRFAMPNDHTADVDNLAKLVMDALNHVLYVDDRQVVQLMVERTVDRDAPRTWIHAQPAQ